MPCLFRSRVNDADDALLQLPVLNSPKFITRSGVLRSFLPFIFVFNFVIVTVIEIALTSRDNSGTNVCADRSLSDLKYADDGGLLIEDPIKLQVFLDCPDDCVGIFGMRFVPSRCKMLLRDFTDSKSVLLLATGAQMDEMDKFS